MLDKNNGIDLEAEKIDVNLREEARLLSKDFNEVMDDCQKGIGRYNQLMEVTQQVLREVAQLMNYQVEFEFPPSSEKNWQDFYNKMSEGLKKCSLLGEAVDKGKSLNDMIGYYLVAAKEEAEKIVLTAQQTANERHQKQLEVLESTIQDRRETLVQHEKKLAELMATENKVKNRAKKTADWELRVEEVEEYANQVKKEADRYSRRRKLLADDQVAFSKREIDDYAAKRENEIKEAEERLTLLTTKLQQKMDSQLSGTLGSISAFAKQEGIDL